MFESRLEKQTAGPFTHLKIGRKGKAVLNLLHESNEER